MRVSIASFVTATAMIAVLACSSAPSTSPGSDAGSHADTGGGDAADGGSDASDGGDGGDGGNGGDTGAAPCSPSNPDGACPSGETCVAGACCATAQACAGQCCTTGYVCLQDGGGNKSCYKSCTDSTECPSSKPCCDTSVNACIPSAQKGCRCSVPSTCSTSCCAPLTDSNGNPVGPYICQNNDGAPYHCCFGISTTCSGNYCCVADSNGNQFCSAPCTNKSQCGNANCNQYDFSHTSCSGPTACGP